MEPKLIAVINNPAIGNRLGTGEGASIMATLISQFLTVIFIIGGVALIFMILWSAIQWITAGDNADAMKTAQKRLAGALIGFILLASALAIVKLAGIIFGVEFLQTLVFNWPSLAP